MDPMVKLNSLFKGPVCTTNWKADRKDESLVRFGILWKMYDLVTQMGLNYRPPILSLGSPHEQSYGWLLGGVASRDFLVQSSGLV